MSNSAGKELQWKKFNVGSDGHVCLVDWMGDDYSIVEAARVSYGEGTKSVSDDRTLIRYLMRHWHSTPFEMAEIKLRVRVSMDTWRQWIRHRTASVNEYSTRYSLAIDKSAITHPTQWRLQSQDNKQGSEGYLNSLYGDILTTGERELQGRARKEYEDRLRFGVAREQARKDLPLSTYTEAYWKIDLHNLFHFLRLRMDTHAQQEIREYAEVVGREIVAKLFPIAWEAFVDYRLESINLNRLDIGVINRYLKELSQGACPGLALFHRVQDSEWEPLKRCRERQECLEKMQQLGML